MRGKERHIRKKYGNRISWVDGMRFDSQGEANRWCQLRLLERAGEIHDLERQVPIQLTAHGKMICKLIIDFRYRVRGELTYEDFKGVKTPDWRIKAKLFEAQEGVKIIISHKGARSNAEGK